MAGRDPRTGEREDDDEEEWRFSLEDLESGDADGSESGDGEAAGPLGGPAFPPIEPESPSAENVLFFLLGALVALGVFALLFFG